MIRKSSRGVVCLSLVVAFFIATPSSQRTPLNPSASALLIRAEQNDSSTAEPDTDLESERAAVCSGTPDFAKGITGSASALSTDVPVFEKDRKYAVLSLIRYPWQNLGYDIVFMGSRPGYRAMTLTARRRIEIYVRPGEGLMNQAYDLAHELGHAFDLKYNNEGRRQQWSKLRGINPATPWFGCDACPDYRTPAGDFAETFAFLLLGPGNYHSLMAPVPKIEQVEELAEFCGIDRLSETLAARLPQKPAASKNQAPKVAKYRATEEAVSIPNPVEEPVLDKAVPETVVKSERPPEITNPDEGNPAEIENATEDVSTKIQAPKADEPLIDPNTIAPVE
jgi:hypothetical protein